VGGASDSGGPTAGDSPGLPSGSQASHQFHHGAQRQLEVVVSGANSQLRDFL
jgi:hypothetical protein